MATKKKLLSAAAGSAGGAGLNVEEVFSTYLYEGNSSTQTITNDIDLSGEGGLVWAKLRSGPDEHVLFDTERGATKQLDTTATTAQETQNGGVTAFNSDGFSVGTNANINDSNNTYASWTWRKAPRFFDCVTWTGDGTNPRNIAHNLGSVPGCFIVKCTSGATDWRVYHRGLSSPQSNNLFLHNTNAASGTSHWSNTAPTSTHFTVSNHANVNASGSTYVAYLFAHNDGDGDFGPTGDQDIIKCGSVSHTQSNGSDSFVDLGFEPQWVMVKNASSGAGWLMYDSMRGFTAKGSTSFYLQPHSSSSEGEEGISDGWIALNSTGFTLLDGSFGTGDYIYIAIRRGPMAVPTDATDVFNATDMSSSYLANTGFPVDLSIDSSRVNSSSNYVNDRLRGSGAFLATDSTAAEASNGTRHFDSNDGVIYTTGFTGINWSWKRAPSFCDVVAYTGNGTAGRTVSHNLGVAPEMMWVKRRDTSAADWAVYHSALGNTKQLVLNTTAPEGTVAYWNNTTPTETNFTLGAAARVNNSGSNFIAYLFASLDGVSKVGSITGTGSDQTIDCGFSSGARFVLTKRTDSTGDWWLNDAERGIVVGNEPLLRLNNTQAEQNTNVIDPHSSGFIAKGSVFVSGGSYIFYAIA